METDSSLDDQSPEYFDGFVSYAREDLAFVEDLITQLATRDLRLWFDLEGIYSGEEWWPRICAAIESADAFIYVISHHSASSPNCKREAEHAASQKKRILPILLQEVPNDSLPAPVSAHQWIFHDALNPKGTADNIVNALEQDPAWHHYHSRLLQRAMEWARTDRTSSLLFGEDLREAQEWLESTDAETGREPSPIQLRFIEASLKGQSDRAAQLSRRLAARVLRETDIVPELAVLLSLAAIDEYAPTPMALRALHASVAAFRGRVKIEIPYAVNGLAFSPDGSELTICTDGGTVLICDANTGNFLEHIKTDGEIGECNLADVAYSPSGDLLALAATLARSIIVFDRKQRTSVAEFDLGEPVSRVAFSPDGQFVVAHSHSGTTKLWNIKSREYWATCSGGASMGSISFFPDSSRLVTPCHEMEAWVWDVSTGGYKTKPMLKLIGHRAQIMDVAVSRDARHILTGSLDGTIQLWCSETGQNKGVIDLGGWVYAVSFSPDGKRIGTLTEIQIGLTKEGTRRPVGHVEIWNRETQTLLKRLLMRPQLGRVLSFSDDWNQLATAGIESETWIWDAHIEEEQLSIHASDTILRHCYCGDDLIAMRIIGGELRVFDVRTGALSYMLPMDWTSGMSVAASANGRQIATQTTEGIVILDATTGHELARLPINQTDRIAFTPQGDHLVTLTGDSIFLWPIHDPENFRILPSKQDIQLTFDLSRDGTRVLTVDPRAARLWDLESGDEIQRVEIGGHEYGDTIAALGPDGRKFAIIKDDIMGIWSDSGEQECQLQWRKYNHESEWYPQPTMATFAPEGGRLATASTDGAVLIWDVVSGGLLQLIALGNDKVAEVAFSANGERIAVRNERDSKVTIWNCLPENRLLEVARSHAFRALTSDERVEYELSEKIDN